MMWMADANSRICASAHLYSIIVHPQKCLNSFFAISSQHVTVVNIYSSMDAAVILYKSLVTDVCLYI